ncbi:MAG: DNA replication/repair protein RecF [Anaerolineae bacterium]|nr:MAG: DNA replication/repair protein RecF [Anaerolineae bacterium]
MHLTHLSLHNFRGFTRLDVDIPAGNILLVGPNAQGKTTILEAIYLLAALTSFHASTDRQLINFIEARQQTAVARIVAEFERAGRSHHLELRIIQERDRQNRERARKQILVDKVQKKLNEGLGHFNAVLFLPQMLGVIEGSPSDRRRYVDLAISQVIPPYASHLADYNKVLSQRNALLKQLQEHGGDKFQLDFWDERLVRHGAEIIHTRIHAIQEIERSAARIHHDLTQSNEVLRLDYRPAYDPVPTPNGQRTLLDAPTDRSGFPVNKLTDGFRTALAESRQQDIWRGSTAIGPHRDDLRFRANGIDLGSYGSRGQVRTTMLTLKMAEVDWIRARTGHMPVLLLDEVLAELDPQRRADLLGRLSGWEQVLMTTTDLNQFDPKFVASAARWNIANGRLEAG